MTAASDRALNTSPISAQVFGHALFNPNPPGERKHHTVYLVGRSPALGPLQNALIGYAAPEQHEPFIPHITAGRGIPIDHLSYSGPILLNLMRVSLAGEVVDFPLGNKQGIKDALAIYLRSQPQSI